MPCASRLGPISIDPLAGRVHFVAHAPWVPRNGWLRRVQTHHRAHHFRNEAHWLAFMVPSLDDWFGTGGEPRDVPRSATTHTPGIESP